MIKYNLIRSDRKTISISIKKDGVTVRAPKRASEAEIERFLKEKENWINKHLEKLKEQKSEAEKTEPLSEEEIKILIKQARKIITQRVEYYAPLIGVKYNKIAIRRQHSRWGSCSSQKNLNFNFLLVLAPDEVLDSVVVHELCHIKEMNHSKRFYNEILRVFPSYYQHHQWLKENGYRLLALLDK